MSERFADGRIRAERVLGSGAMGIVHEAFDEARGATVALKVLRRFSGAAIYRFKKEFRALAEIAHPNLVALHELFSEGERTYFTMELVDGVSIVDWARAPGDRAEPGFDEARGRAAFAQLAEGIAALHAARCLHRDLKPSNVMVSPDGRVRILDFGLISSDVPSEQTADGGLVGTPTYMAPEQAKGLEVTPAADWYAFGVLLFEALTGRPPFTTPGLPVLVEKTRHEAPRAASLVAGTPGDLDELAARLLAREPSARPRLDEILGVLAPPAPQDVAAGSRSSGNLAIGRSGSFLAEIGRASAAIAQPSFVGRARELEALHAALHETRQPRAVCVTVRGASGIGKSQLVRRFLAEAEMGEVDVLRGRCFEHESVPFKALDAVIDALSAHLRKLPSARVERLLPRGVSALTKLFPVLQRVEAIAAAQKRAVDIPDRHERRRRAARALRELLERLCEARPLIVWIDDLQWGDLDSAALLVDLLRPPDAPPLLFVGSHRSEDHDAPFLRALRDGLADDRDLLVREIEVGPLGPADARELARQLLGAAAEDPELPALVAEESEGSPFLIEQLARHHALEGGEGAPRASRRARLDEVVRTRLSALAPDARALLEVVATCGQPLRREVAVRAAGLEGSRALPALSLLRSARWVRARGKETTTELECYHDKIRAAVVASIEPARLREVHRALAESLRAADDADPEQLMLHYDGAGDVARVRALAETAAERAMQALAFERAARLFQRALEQEGLTTAARSALSRKLADAWASAGKGLAAAEAYLAAADEAEPAEALVLRHRAADQYLGSGHIDAGLSTLSRVLRAVGLRLHVARVVVLALLFVEWARLRARGLRFERRAREQIPEQLRLQLEVCWSVGAGISVVHPLTGRLFQTRHLRLALDAGDARRVAIGFALYAVTNAFHGTRGTAATATLLARMDDAASGLDDPLVEAWRVGARALCAFLEGSYREAIEGTDRALLVYRERTVDTQWEIASVHVFAAWSLFYLGELRELAQRVASLGQEARERGDVYLATSLRIGLLNAVWLAAGDPDRAEAELVSAMAAWGRSEPQLQQYYELISRVQIALHRGRGREALSLIDARWGSLRKGLLLQLQNVRVEALHLRARAALAAFDETADARLLDRAEADARRITDERTTNGDALASLAHAAVIAARGDVPGAIRCLEGARLAFEGREMRLFAAAAQHRLGALLADAEGAERIADATRTMRAESIKNPARWLAVLAPGFERALATSPSTSP